MALSISHSVPQCRWPRDLEAIGLTSEEVYNIEHTIVSLWNELPRYESGGCMTCTLRRGILITYPDGTEVPLSRTVVVTHRFALVMLKGKVIKGGAQNPTIKQVYDPFNATILLKKRIFSPAQLMVVQFIFHTAGKNDLALATITHVESGERNGKLLYYEELCKSTLTTMYLNVQKVGYCPKVSLDHVRHLLNTLQYIHVRTYDPARIQGDQRGPLSLEKSLPFWHGDISPDNVVYMTHSSSVDFCHYRLIDWGSSMSKQIVRTPGWGSPEKIEFIRRNPKYRGLTSLEFNKKYAQAGDVWSLALLIASLLRGGFYYLPESYAPIPSFSFIKDRLHLLEDGGIDDLGLATLTQKEVDDRLDLQLATITGDSIADEQLKKMWGHIRQWLKVNPDERPTLADLLT
jgi:serine/threonine protein kinase